jgi:hypothetical protein
MCSLRPSSFFSHRSACSRAGQNDELTMTDDIEPRRSHDPPNGRSIHPSIEETDLTKTTPEQNKALVLEAFETLFKKRDYAAPERFGSDHYIQHSAHITPGRTGLFDLIRAAPETLLHENRLTVAESDYVITHGGFSGIGLYTVSDPRISRSYHVENWTAALRQLAKD